MTRHNVLSALAPLGEFAQLLPEAILLVSGDGLLLTANGAAAHLFGRAADELVGRPLAQFCLDDEQAVAALLRASARSRHLVPGSLTISLPDGGRCACRCEGAVYQPRSAQAPATVMLRVARKEAAVGQFILLNQRIDDLSREVAKRRRVESELRITTERLRVTLGSIGDAVIATDDTGRITFMNGAAEQLTGWRFELASGRHLDEVFVIVHEETGRPVESPVAKALRCGTVVGLANHTMLIRADGTRLPIDDSGAPMRDENGAVMGVVLVFHDISERHAMQGELLLRAQRLEEADRRKDEFLSMLAHELRNPLAPLRMGVQLLARQHGGIPGVLRLAEMMERQTGHMVRLVDDLLDVSRLTRGTIALHRARVSLAEVMEQAIEMCQPAMQARGVTLAFEPWPADAQVEGDSTRLVQVFANLLSNATKFTESGGQVVLRARVDGDSALVSVRDSGIGIVAELLPRVFDLFVQGEQSLDRSQGGLGVGLTIVRSIVELHGGAIRAHSDGLGQGSEFVVSLPLVAGGARRDEGGASAPATPLAHPESALRVLVVDDNIDAAQTLCSILERWGHETRAAYGARDALELMAVVRPDAVLLDIGLPGMNGYELARAIRLLPELEGMLLVAVTGYGDENARLQSSQAGYDHHLTKPVDPETLRSLLSRHVARTA